eukprot:5462119-Pyramimonas_sp.AAC.1
MPIPGVYRRAVVHALLGTPWQVELRPWLTTGCFTGRSWAIRAGCHGSGAPRFIGLEGALKETAGT